MLTTTDDPGLQRIARFWDARGREDALRYSVPGGGPIDDAAFVASGHALLDTVHQLVGWSAPRDAVVADVGCGAGRIAGALAQQVEQVIAYDVATKMLAAGRERLADVGNVTWQHAHAGDLSLQETASVDAVVLLGVLAHLPDLEAITDALGEAARVVEPDGTVLFDVRSGPAPLVLPGEERVPPHVVRHPLWQGVAVDLETLAAIAQQEWLELERIEGSDTGRCLVLARRV